MQCDGARLGTHYHRVCRGADGVEISKQITLILTSDLPFGTYALNYALDEEAHMLVNKGATIA